MVSLPLHTPATGWDASGILQQPAPTTCPLQCLPAPHFRLSTLPYRCGWADGYLRAQSGAGGRGGLFRPHRAAGLEIPQWRCTQVENPASAAPTTLPKSGSLLPTENSEEPKRTDPGPRSRCSPQAFLPSEDQPRLVMPTLSEPSGAKHRLTIPAAQPPTNRKQAPWSPPSIFSTLPGRFSRR